MKLHQFHHFSTVGLLFTTNNPEDLHDLFKNRAVNLSQTAWLPKKKVCTSIWWCQ